MFLILILILPSYSFAREVRENYNGIRGLSMGGASIGVVNDETALLVNPAGLGKLRDFYGTILDPESEGGANLIEMYKLKAFTNPLDLEQVRDTLMYNPVNYFHYKAQLFPSFVMKNFGIGIHGKRLLDARMNQAQTEMETFYQDDVSIVMGINIRFFEGRIKIGAVGKAISRIEIDEEALDPTGTMEVSQLASEGVGIGYDVGIILSAPIVWLPSISAVMRDVGGTPFTAGSGVRMKTANRPNTIEQDIDVAFSLFPIHGNKTRSQFSIQMDKIKEAGLAQDRTRYYHVGYEFNYGDMIFVRAGMNQKYITGGLEFETEHMQFQVGTYGEDVGTDGASVEDRRYIGKFSIRF